MPRLIPAVVIAAQFAVASAAYADDVPRLNIEPVCRAIAKTAGDQRNIDVCMRSEDRSRTALAKDWNTFPPADRSSCLSLTKMGGVGGTYSELLTCLEMSRDVRKLHNSAGTVGIGGR